MFHWRPCNSLSRSSTHQCAPSVSSSLKASKNASKLSFMQSFLRVTTYLFPKPFVSHPLSEAMGSSACPSSRTERQMNSLVVMFRPVSLLFYAWEIINIYEAVSSQTSHLTRKKQSEQLFWQFSFMQSVLRSETWQRHVAEVPTIKGANIWLFSKL